MPTITTQQAIQLTADQRLVARLWSRDLGNHPVTLSEGPQQAPKKIGGGYYHTTLSGKKIVEHPSAYGWPTLYHASTIEITVGYQWLLSHPITRIRVAGITFWGLSADIQYLHGLRITPGWISGKKYTLIEGDREYHAVGWDARAAVREALRAWRRQIQSDREHRRISGLASRIWVSAEDSIAAGNCPIGTSLAISALSARLGVPPDGTLGAVRADYLLGYRDDRYVRRAICQAARRVLA